jgi:hypothetical protein
MIYDATVTFKESRPSVELFLEKLKEATGLSIIYDERISEFNNPEDSMDFAAFYYEDDNKIVFLDGGPAIYYLLGASLNVLKSLGGEYKGYIPEWTSKKWDEIKTEANTLPNFSFPKFRRN